MRGTASPMLWAERREPPTAMIRQPMRKRVKTICSAKAMSERIKKLTGRPMTEPSPMKYHGSLSIKLPAMATEYLSSIRSTIERRMISVTNVVKNARSLK